MSKLWLGLRPEKEEFEMAQTETAVAEVSQAVHEKRRWFIALGVILILIGTGAIVFPFLATVVRSVMLTMIAGMMLFTHFYISMMAGW